MKKSVIITQRSHLGWLLLSLLMVVAMLFSTAGASTPALGPAHAQPELLQMAARQPQQVVSVIVQMAARSTGLEDEIARLGGRVTAHLSIIRALAAEIPAEAVMQLASNPRVRWVSLDSVMESSGCSQCIDTSKLATAYISAIRANKVWNAAPYDQGQGIGVAIIDSGINPNGDLYTNSGVNRQVADVRFNSDYNQSPSDGFGHGTFVASIVAGDGSDSSGKYIGVAPLANIINVKVTNDNGSASMKDVVLGLQWVLQNKATYNIRVINLSLNSTAAESYNSSPLDAAVEILWFNGVVVVVSSGNKGNGAIYPPANDPFVITVGAVDDKGTAAITDDVVANFSAYGNSEDGAVKPDLVAPGTNIVGRLVNQNMGMAQAHPANKVGTQYFQMSGTSTAAPIVAGAVALLLQDEPALTPDQVKYRLMATANKSWNGYKNFKAGAGYLDVYAAVNGATNQSVNTGILPSQLLSTGPQPITWGSVGWNSVGWNSVGWNSVGWNSVGWNSVGWNSDYWGH